MLHPLGKIPQHVSFLPRDPKSYDIVWAVDVLFNTETDGRLACVIPALDLYFAAKNIDHLDQKSLEITKLYFDHFHKNQKNGVKNLVLQLHKLGFKSNNDVDTVHKLINNKVLRAKFKAPFKEIAEEFAGAENRTQETSITAEI